MEFTCVKEVEDLHHHEDVKYKGVVSRIDLSGLKHCLIVFASTDIVEPPAAHSAPDHSILPLIFRVTCKDTSVVRISILRYKSFPPKHENYQNYDLKDSLANDVL
jgi:hypothetical protein